MRSLGAATFGNVRFDELVVDAESARRAAAKRGESGKRLAAYAKLWFAFDALRSSSCPSPPLPASSHSGSHISGSHLLETPGRGQLIPVVAARKTSTSSGNSEGWWHSRALVQRILMLFVHFPIWIDKALCSVLIALIGITMLNPGLLIMLCAKLLGALPSYLTWVSSQVAKSVWNELQTMPPSAPAATTCHCEFRFEGGPDDNYSVFIAQPNQNWLVVTCSSVMGAMLATIASQWRC